MQYRSLGRTGLQVSEIGFGAWGIGAKMWKGGDDKSSMQALNKAVDAGINFFDTALAYGDGHSEELIGRLLKEREEELYVATKIPPFNKRWPAQGTLNEAFPRHHIVNSVETSLRNLGQDSVDLVQLHVWDPSWLDDLRWHEALCDLRQMGRLRFFGVSINDHQPDTALDLVERGLVDSVQVIYNIFDQSPTDQLFQLCWEKRVGVIVRVPFDEGALTGKVTPETHFSRRDWRSRYFKDDRKQQVWERVQKIVQETGIGLEELPRLALRFCLHPRAVGTVIPGMRRTKHVEANASVSDLPPLDDETLEILKRHRWERNFYP
ncbi:MAG TPA: aldo/keto reductase [Acidobacteriota bacterium]|nr:aldo/keto reductase [Acidobacteriota bacterium]